LKQFPGTESPAKTFNADQILEEMFLSPALEPSLAMRAARPEGSVGYKPCLSSIGVLLIDVVVLEFHVAKQLERNRSPPPILGAGQKDRNLAG
jgi:hypothetical protein